MILTNARSCPSVPESLPMQTRHLWQLYDDPSVSHTCTAQTLVDEPDSVPRPLTPMKRPRSASSGPSCSSAGSRTMHTSVADLRHELQQAHVHTG